MWIVTVHRDRRCCSILTRGRAMLPGKAQNAIEHVWELIEGFAMSLGGPAGQARTSRCSRASSSYILFCNWSGLIPPIGKVGAPRRRRAT